MVMADDPVPWAKLGPVAAQLIGRRLPWEGGGRPDADQEELERLARIASVWANAPATARRLNLPPVSPEQVVALWKAAPHLCAAAHVPQPRIERAEE